MQHVVRGEMITSVAVMGHENLGRGIWVKHSSEVGEMNLGMDGRKCATCSK